MEMLAYATWRAGKKDEALKIYADVQALPDVPQGVKRRSIEPCSLCAYRLKASNVKDSRIDANLGPGSAVARSAVGSRPGSLLIVSQTRLSS